MNDFKSEENRTYPLTHPQKRIWYIEKMYPNTSLYNIGGTVIIKGPVDLEILEKAIHSFIEKAEGVRLRFVEENSVIKQYVSTYKKEKLPYKDFSNSENPEMEFEQWVSNDALKPFQLENEELFKFVLFHVSEKCNGYYIKCHHMIADGWSISVMAKYICDAYMSLLESGIVSDDPIDSYLDYIESEEKYLSSERCLRNKEFWTERFESLPESFLVKSSDILTGKRKTFELSSELSRRIKEFSLQYKYSINTIFVFVYMLYMSKTTQQDDLVIGVPVYNRRNKKEKNMFGMFTSSMPFRFVMDGNGNIKDTINSMNQQLRESYFNQQYPYDLLVQDLELKKRGLDSLFNTCVNYYNTKLDCSLNGVPVDNVEFYCGNQVYSLQLLIKDWLDSGNLTLSFDYKTDDYSEMQILDMYRRIVLLLEEIIENSDKKISDISLLTEEEQNVLLYNFNATTVEYPRDKTIYQLFEEQVKENPKKTAVMFHQNSLNYEELNKKANQVARYLQRHGVGRGDIIGILTSHSIETVVGILGILKAGAAYLPLDITYPKERLKYMLHDSNAKILLTNVKLFDPQELQCPIFDLRDSYIYMGESEDLPCMNQMSDLAYIIYTSGTTGEPKGTMLEHQGLMNYIWWAKKMYIKDMNEVFAFYSSLAFDLTITSIFTPIISGTTIAIYDPNEEDDDYVLYRILRENIATIVKLTPSHLSLMKDRDNSKSKIRTFIVGGENLKVNIAKKIYESFQGKVDIFNEYGPTETVVGCMIYRYNYELDQGVSVPIGVPADNVQLYILDKNKQLVFPGTVGELYISGDGVARGYMNHPQITNERFLVNPFDTRKRMYKTGDLVRLMENKTIEYVGRTDFQVKIRGYRIELSEIEKYLLSHEAIQDAVVIDLQGKQDNRYLCAYIVKKQEISTHELRSFLSKYLPDYMIPLYFVEVDKIPLTSNGKVDRQALPQCDEDTNYEASDCTNENEKQLVDIIQDVFQIEGIGVKHNFYHLGGDSIKAIQISSKLREIGFDIQVKDILSNPIIEDMAAYIKRKESIVIDQDSCKGEIPNTPIVAWFLNQQYYNPNYYNQSILCKIRSDIPMNLVETAMNQLIQHHDSMRINYDRDSGTLFYNDAYLTQYFSIKEYDLSDQTESEQRENMLAISNELKASFDIEKGLLIHACIFQLGDQEKVLLITAHHFIIDGVSMRILMEDMNMVIEQLMEGKTIELPLKTSSLKDWSKAISNHYEKNNGECEYWDKILSKSFQFPSDFASDEDTLENCDTLTGELEKELTEALLTKANEAYQTNARDLLVTALLKSIKDYTGKTELMIELEGHGRNDIIEDIDVSRTIGWFTSLYPFAITLSQKDLSEQIKAVKEEIRKIPEDGIGYGVYRYLLHQLEDKQERYIRFNYLGDFISKEGNQPIQLLSDQFGNDCDIKNSFSCILELNCYIVEGKLYFMLRYSKNRFLVQTIQEFFNQYLEEVKSVIQHCTQKETIDFTPSDFDTIDISLDELDSLFQ